MAGPAIRLPAATLRSSGLEVIELRIGGHRQWRRQHTTRSHLRDVPRLWDLAEKGELRIDAEPGQRRDLGGRRLVLVP
jgi:hypothetical protein